MLRCIEKGKVGLIKNAIAAKPVNTMLSSLLCFFIFQDNDEYEFSNRPTSAKGSRTIRLPYPQPCFKCE